MSSGEEPLETETRSHRAGGRREGGDKGGVVGSEKMQAGSKRRKVGIESNEASSTVTGKRVRFEHTEDVNESESDADGSGRTREDSERESEGKSSGGDDRYIDDSGDSVLEEGEENALRMVEGEGESEGEGEEGRGEARYLPPHMKDSGKSSQSRPGSERLQRALQGLVNRYMKSQQYIQLSCTCTYWCNRYTSMMCLCVLLAIFISCVCVCVCVHVCVCTRACVCCVCTIEHV